LYKDIQKTDGVPHPGQDGGQRNPPRQLYIRDVSRHGNVAVHGGDCAGRMTYVVGRGRGVERVRKGRGMGSVMGGREWKN
jgi:hypothetical protein